MAKKAASKGMTTYMLNMGDGTKQKITIPSAWILTFGPIIPGVPKDSNSRVPAVALRIYDGKQQKAVFTGVESFRDTSIEILVETVKTEQETFYRGEGKDKQAVVMEARVREWQNPDQPKREMGAAPVALLGNRAAREVAGDMALDSAPETDARQFGGTGRG